jgi:hypothetical protein
MVVEREDPRSNDSPSAKRPQPITPNQARARRENAKQSTGPRTKAGKDKSRANAVKHALWAKTIPFISRGPVREDANEVEQFRNAIIDELDPHTPLKMMRAARIANLAWRVAIRLPRWETAALCDDNWASQHEDIQAQLGREYARIGAESKAWAIATLRNLDEADQSADALENAVSEVWCMCRGEPETPGWSPEEGIRPASGDEWRQLIDAIWPLAGESLEAVINKIERDLADLRRKARESALAESGSAIRTVLGDGFLDRLVGIECRLSRELAKELEQYSS